MNKESLLKIGKSLAFVASVFLSGVGGVWWAGNQTEVRLVRQAKIDVLRQVAANRDDVSRVEFTSAINQVFVVYADSEAVLDKLKNVILSLDPSNKNASLANHYYMELMLEMSKDIGIEFNTNYMSFYFEKVLNGNKTHNNQMHPTPKSGAAD